MLNLALLKRDLNSCGKSQNLCEHALTSCLPPWSHVLPSPAPSLEEKGRTCWYDGGGMRIGVVHVEKRTAVLSFL